MNLNMNDKQRDRFFKEVHIGDRIRLRWKNNKNFISEDYYDSCITYLKPYKIGVGYYPNTNIKIPLNQIVYYQINIDEKNITRKDLEYLSTDEEVVFFEIEYLDIFIYSILKIINTSNIKTHYYLIFKKRKFVFLENIF